MSLTGVRQNDANAFARTAGWFKLYILVRATNPASLPYMSLSGYAAKRLDCKAKTSDANASVNGRPYKTNGLVVSPEVLGPSAFTAGRYFKAMEAWADFAPKLAAGIYGPDGKPTKTYFPNGKFYGVQMDPKHEHYGCVMFASSSLISAATYIHGDYDLYAIVDPAKPATNVFVPDAMLGHEHTRSKELVDVQTMVNRLMGRPMVLHGSQETYTGHSDEPVHAFFPDGRTVKTLNGKGEIEAFYATTFAGRKVAAAGAQLAPAGGQYVRVR